MRRSVRVGVASVTAVAFLAVPSIAFAQDDGDTEEATESSEVVVEESSAPEPAPAPPAPATKPAPAPAPEPVAEDSGDDPEPQDTGGGESAPAPEPAAAPAPAPAPAPAVEPASSAGNVAPATAVAEDTGGGGGISESSGEIRSSSGSVAGTSGGVCGRSHPGPTSQGPLEGSNPEIDAQLEADGCTKLNPDQTTSAPVTVDGVTFEFTVQDNGQGDEVHFTVTNIDGGGTANFTLVVKGGSDQQDGGHWFCTFENVAVGGTGFCHAPVNPQNNKYYGFSHLHICGVTRTTTTTPPDGFTPPDGGGTQGGGGGGGQPGGGGGGGDVQQEEEAGEAPPPPPAPTPAAAAPAAAEELPFTGIDLGWLAVMAASLLLGGALLRRTAS